MAFIEQRLDQIKENTEEIKTTVQVMRDKPGKHWDGLVEKAVWAVCAAVIAFPMAKVRL